MDTDPRIANSALPVYGTHGQSYFYSLFTRLLQVSLCLGIQPKPIGLSQN